LGGNESSDGFRGAFPRVIDLPGATEGKLGSVSERIRTSDLLDILIEAKGLVEA
jgi:hypothetical protein